MSRSPIGLLVGLLAASLLLTACPLAGSGSVDAGPGEDLEATSALAQRFAPSRLPWKVAAGATTEAYPVSIPSSPPRQVQAVEPRWKALVLDRETVAVVFPPEDHVGFDIAWGGFNKPWQRAPLTRLPVNDVGSLDAVVDGERTVWLAFRPRARNTPLTLVHWREGSQAVEERLPAPSGQELTRLPYMEACPDMTLGVSPSGALDVVMRGDPAQWLTQLFHGRRAPGATTFTWNLVADGSKSPERPGLEQVWDFGCRSALAYDELGRLMVLSLARATRFPFASPIKMQVVAFREGRDGRLWNAGFPVVSLPDSEDNYLRGAFDLHDHPSGFLFSAPSRLFQPKSNEPLGRLPWVYARAYSPVRNPYPFDGQERFPDDHRFVMEASQVLTPNAPGSGGKLVADGCGNFRLASVPFNDVVSDWAEGPMGKLCDEDPAPAPVFRAASALPLQHPVFARGRQLPFEFAVCIDTERTLHVCHGGHVGSRAAGFTASFSPELEGPLATIASTQPAAGEALAVASLGAAVVVTFDRPLQFPLRTQLELWDLSNAQPRYGEVKEVPGRPEAVQFQPREPLAEGHRFRLVVHPRMVEGTPLVPTWKLPEGRRAVVDFTTRGDGGPLAPDAWTFPFGLTCPLIQGGSRDDGGCTFTLDDSSYELVRREGALRVFATARFAFDWERSDGGPGWVEELDGGRLLDAGAVARTNLDYIDLTLPSLPEHHAVRVHIPGQFDLLGREFADETFVIQTLTGPLRVEGFVPADGAVVATPPAFVDVLVNRAQRADELLHPTYFLFEELSTQGPEQVVGSVAATRTLANPTTYRVTPESPLLAGHRYRLRVPFTPPSQTVFTIAP